MVRTTGRMNTSVERHFRPMPGGLYREVILKFINFMNEDGTIRSSKLDEEIFGALYKPAKSDSEQSQYGEIFYKFPEQDKPTRLLCIGKELGDYQYGRQH
jgi:hypothetical protein